MRRYISTSSIDLPLLDIATVAAGPSNVEKILSGLPPLPTLALPSDTPFKKQKKHRGKIKLHVHIAPNTPTAR